MDDLLAGRKFGISLSGDMANRIRRQIFSLIDKFKVMLEPGAVGALVSWPQFSITSYKMVMDLSRQGIVPRTVIDVGANVGQFSVAAAKLFPNVRIFSFEPMPASVAKLRGNLSGIVDATVYPIALGASEGTAELHINSHSHSSSLLPLSENHLAAFPEAREVSAMPVKVSTLDVVLKDVDLAAPVLLKLDVQGYEAATLQGGSETLKRIDYVVLEGSLKPLYQGETIFIDLIRMMEEHRFRFLRPVGSLANPATGEIIQMDLLFGRST